jgi:hypothetical protein
MSLLLLATLPMPKPLTADLSAKVSRRGRSRLPEVAFARGPLLEGNTGDGSVNALFGLTWALVWHSADGLLLFRHGATGWNARLPLLPLPVLPQNARHVSLAFDQAARPVIAWEVAGEVFVRQWDTVLGAFVVRGPFVGVDPLLVNDARVLGAVAGSDVVLVHLSQNRLNVVNRIQGDQYSVARAVAALSNPVYADQILELPKKLAVRLGTDTGLELELESDFYPFELRDTALARLAGPSAGVLFDVVITKAPSPEGITGTLAGPSAGVLFDVVITKAPSLEGITGTLAGPSAGVLFDVVITKAPSLEGITGTLAGPSAGVLLNAVQPYVPGLEAVTATLSGPSGGVLA